MSMMRVGAILFVFSVSGCGQLAKPGKVRPEAEPEPVSMAAKPAGVAAREKAALRFAEQGRDADALVQWKILRAIDPQSRHYPIRIQQIEARINAQVAQRMSTGNAALAKGDHSAAQRDYLAVLALDPANTEALKKLRGLEYDRVWGIQAAKLDKLQSMEERKMATASEQERFYFELGTLMFRQGDYAGAVREVQKYLNSYPKDAQAKKLIADAHAKLAESLRQQGQFKDALDSLEQAKRYNGNKSEKPSVAENEVRKALADEYFTKGLRARATNLNLAIEMWQKALEYNPDHANAKLRLNEALRMQKNLERIGK